MLRSSQVDHILKAIDAFDPDLSAAGDFPVSMENFAVLDLGRARARETHCPTGADPGAPHAYSNTYTSATSGDPVRGDAMALQSSPGLNPLAQTTDPTIHADPTPVTTPLTEETHDVSLRGTAVHNSGYHLDADSGSNLDKTPTNIESDLAHDRDTLLQPDIATPVGGPAVSVSSDGFWLRGDSLSTDCVHLCDSAQLDQFLMRHYSERVSHLFCAIDTPKSPWRTIHLPRAMQSMGEISATGKTTKVRHALLKALLSISAWYLSNDHQRHDDGTTAGRWAHVATRYSCDAMMLLQQAVEMDLYPVPRPKYKDFLATMLSMVTMNVSIRSHIPALFCALQSWLTNMILEVMSGDTSTCGVHLDGAGQLISHMWSKKQRFSQKARALHRIYCYLRVIWESTSVESVLRRSSDSRSGSDESVFCRFGERSRNERSIAKSPVVRGPGEMTSYECIYGIPQNLLVMLEEITTLICKADRARDAAASPHLPDSLSEQSDELEQAILDWSPEDWAPSLSAVAGTSERLILCQTKAFHSALVIFFSQNIRLLHHRYLQAYVETVLTSIETIEEIKMNTNVLAAPLFWPAFIAATEAFDAPHQARFRQWYAAVGSYGIAAVRTGVSALDEVWSAGPRRKGHTSVWRSVISESRKCLMLT